MIFSPPTGLNQRTLADASTDFFNTIAPKRPFATRTSDSTDPTIRSLSVRVVRSHRHGSDCHIRRRCKEPRPMLFPVTEHFAKTARHASFYLACGPETGPLIIFIHGWPELAHSWRHQLRALAALGFRCIAPDMRGYGRSSSYPTHAEYALDHSVRDMLDLLAHLGRDRAIWVGHDWGIPVVWSLTSQHPERCYAVANLCVPYITGGFATANLIPLVNREIYPESTYL